MGPGPVVGVEGSPPQQQQLTFKIPPLIKRNTLFLAITQALVGMAMQMVPTLTGLMVVQLLGSAALAGIGTSIQGVSRFLVAYPIGKIMDVYGRRVGLALGLSVSLVGSVWLGISMLWASFAVFLAGMFILGLGTGAVQQLRLAAADMYPPSRRAEGLGYVLTGALVGALGGPLLITMAQAAARRLEMDPLALTWIFVPVVIVPCIALVLLVRPDPREIGAHLERYYPDYVPPVHDAGARVTMDLGAFIRHYPRQVAFVCSFATQGNMALMMVMTALVLAHHGHSLPSISLSVAIHVIGMFGLSLPLGSLADRIGRRAVMLAGVVLAGAGTLLVPVTPDYWVVTAGIFLVGLGWSCVNVAASALLVDTTAPAERGQAIGINDTFSATSAIVLPLVGGPVVEYLGFSFLAPFGVALMVVPFILLLRLRETSPGKYMV
ncbi:MAG: MFS transporter [Chloroflexi bacterium]|nr:MFS transporter [Chloroflexota bacterium]